MTERPGWQKIAEDAGFTFHHNEGQRYWHEGAVYVFSLTEIERDIEAPTAELHAMCLDLVDDVVKNEEKMARLAIPLDRMDLVANSWAARDMSLYGRFDLAYNGEGPAKMLEYNADTPTSIYETAVFQWQWLEDMIASGGVPEDADQFNALHDALVIGFGGMGPRNGFMHFASVADHLEDRQTVRYLEDVARQAGLRPQFVPIDQIGLSDDGKFVDQNGVVIERIFKLYPWEDMLREEFSAAIAASGTHFVEPAWKAVLSNKALLPLLWQAHRGHPNLLPAAFDDDDDALKAEIGPDHVRKPIFSREGWDIEIVTASGRVDPKQGGYGEEGFILQQYQPLPVFDGQHAVIGSWVVGRESVALSMREDDGPVTRDLARFVPHVIWGD